MIEASYPALPGEQAPMCSIRVARGDSAAPLRIDELPDGVLVASDEGRIVAANTAFLELVGRELFVWFPDGQGRSKLTTASLERAVGSGTGRNWNSVTRLLAMAEELEAG